MSIRRRAIIIGNNTGLNAPTFLSGVNLDLINYVKYLRSGIGGQWLDHEITVLHNKRRQDVLAAIKQCQADFSFVVFSGHGFIDSSNGQTFICVDGGYVSESELNTYIHRQTLILDCCREVSGLSESHFNASGRDSFEKGGPVAFTGRTIIDSRAKFDTAIGSSGIGRCIGYACLVDETSGDNASSGGVFSSALINVGKRFGSVDNPNGFWLPIMAATNSAAHGIKRNPFTSQTPSFKTNINSFELTHPFALTNKIVRRW